MVEVPRDRWQRPLIIPADGGDPVPYVRVSTLAKTLDDLSNLMAWKQRKTAEGLVRRPDLLTRISGAINNGDPDTDWPTKRELNKVCREAMDAASASKGASVGTGLHALTEAVDRGEEPQFVPDADRARLDAYRQATAGYTPLASEQFVVCDELAAAGTFDRLWRTPDGRVVVGDLKTGKSDPDYPLAVAMQLAIYAHGDRYDPETGGRSPLHEGLNRTVGLLVHLPASGGCRVVPLDLERGWRAACLAVQVREVRGWKADVLKVRGGAEVAA